VDKRRDPHSKEAIKVEDTTPIDWITTPELLSEIFRRFDQAVLIGLKLDPSPDEPNLRLFCSAAQTYRHHTSLLIRALIDMNILAHREERNPPSPPLLSPDSDPVNEPPEPPDEPGEDDETPHHGPAKA